MGRSAQCPSVKVIELLKQSVGGANIYFIGNGKYYEVDTIINARNHK